MVSSAFISPCSTTMTSKGKCRLLHVDYSKDYGKSLHVETSVEYDLPSHIYPPKGSEPILMIQSACQTSSKPVEKKYSVKPLPHSPLGLVNNKSRPLAALQLHSNHAVVRNTKKTNRSSGVSSLCSNLHCNDCNINRPTSVVQEVGNVLNDNRIIKPRSKVPENIFYNPVNSLHYSTNVKTLRHREIQQKAQVEKQLQTQQEQLVLQQQQLSLQQAQQQIKLGLGESARLQAAQKNAKIPRQQIFSEQLEQAASWNVADLKCQGICCRGNNVATQSSIPTSQSTFVAPSLPLSLISRTPSRGSPKVRSRSRRGISIASSVNLPEYIGAARTIRTTAISAEALNRTQMRATTDVPVPGVPIINNTATSNIDIGLALGTVFTSTPVTRSLYQNLNQVGIMPSAGISSLPTLEQDKDITATLNAEKVSINSSNRLELANYTNSSRLKSQPPILKSVKGLWSTADSRYCTSVDITADAIFSEPFNNFQSNVISSNPQPTMLIQNEPSNTAVSWMKHFTGPLQPTFVDRGGLNSLFFHHQTTTPYIPQSIWNLAY